ncbi:DUF4011 domain-containing protein [Sandarakinorhabdus sp. AAP62]|uniref:DUF4011 domain-containing protein n=1 Tax=Sandarakinorhabdus sp. AAP62 TaxID=1248916 RepID=UPI00036F834A|nr:DUF4011 domain-containing protein [Sandarakinorhabdus sp. AAP62]
MTDEQRWTYEAVAGLRTKLIDLGKRNPLIAFKHGGRSTSHIRIVDERPDLLLKALQEGPLQFEPLPDEDITPQDERTPAFQIAYERARLTDPLFLAATEKLGDDEADMRQWQSAERLLRQAVRHQLGLPALDYGKALDVKALAKAHGFDPSFDLRGSDDDDVAEHHEDNRIRVLLTTKELGKRLKTIYEKYRSHQRETGLHTLFLCLGFVQWYEDDASDVQHHAPILTLPVHLEQRVVRGRYEYTLVEGDEDLEVNVALQEKMRQHWGLETPELGEDESPEEYFARLEEILAQGRRLSLRRFATVAILPFPRMILWKDLDPSNWPPQAFANHTLLPGLLNARSFDGEPAPLETPDIDREPLASKAPPLIQPADASQHAALIDVAEGQSLAIEGPPGTGKSQTITNMIASALKDGKRVLFVAEKQAALSVVASRLRQSGLGPLLLELHGDTAKRDTVYAGLRERLNARPSADPARLSDTRAELARKRDLIRRYLSLIGEPLGSLGKTAYQLSWREIRLRSLLPAGIDTVANGLEPKDIESLDAATLKERREALSDFGIALAALRTSNGETLWMAAERLNPFDQADELAAAGTAAMAARTLANLQAELTSLGITWPGPRSNVGPAVDQLRNITAPSGLDELLLQSALRQYGELKALHELMDRWHECKRQLELDVEAPAELPNDAVAALCSALADMDDIPDAISQVHDQLAQLRAAEEAVERIQAEIGALSQIIPLPVQLLSSSTPAVMAALSILGEMPSATAAIASPTLLEPVARLALEREAGTAAEIRREREALTALLTPEGLEAGSSELTSTADVLEQAGMFARLFDGAFKASDRRSRRWLKGTEERPKAIEMLRRAARHHRTTSSFRNDSPARSLFPALLWTGADADWEAALGASSALVRAEEQLRAHGAADMLIGWLRLGAADRSRAAAIAGRVTELAAPHLAMLSAPLSWPALENTIVESRGKAERLVEALHKVGARADGMIRRGGKLLADRIGELARAEADHALQAEKSGFDWASSVRRNPAPLKRVLDHVDALNALAGPLSIAEAARRADKPLGLLTRLAEVTPLIEEAKNKWDFEATKFAILAEIDATKLATSWSELADHLASMSSDAAGVRACANLLKYRSALREAGLDAYALSAVAGDVAPDELANLYEWIVVRSLVRSYVGGSGAELGRLGSLTLDGARRAFVALDKELQNLEAAAIVAARLSDKPPRGKDSGPVGGFTDAALLQHELGLRRPRTSLREVTHRAAAALKALKPVWMMSPTSAAQFIRPGDLTFDLLVIDEASQMRPEFAVSAIMRAEQIVVVGDANQLPPSDFFSASGTDDDEDMDETVVVNSESILDLANQRLRRKRRLRWHYRSQHEDLIQYSNREFYERDLIVFPSPTTDDELLGVKSRYVGGTYEASINQEEAQAVIEEAFRLMRAYPERSLGIATMNAKQAELIQNEFNRLQLEEPEVRAYIDFHNNGIEEFFIKNLENVQGDERDIILISTVYGPDKNGTVMQRFGPMNQQVGWRRLNVLVTRAKLSTRVFTSLRPNDIKITEKSSKGVMALKSYLTYAMKGAATDSEVGGDFDSDFEMFVAEKLRAHGYDVVPQVGVEGFRIDLGVRHPDYPIGFIAGVECDGARWHTGLSVRDRDRIRQTILENMGWRIHRIWSTDWFADPDHEMAKLLHNLEEWRAKAAAAFASRPRTEPSPEDLAPEQELIELAPPNEAQAPAAVATPSKNMTADEETEVEEPLGKQMRPLDGIDWYEVLPGRRYAVVIDGDRAGSVEVISRAMGAPRIYGGALIVTKSEFEGEVARTGERFRNHDIYACVREVARRAKVSVGNQ